MTTKKTVLIIAGVVGVLGLIVVLFVAGIFGFVVYQLGNSEAARKSEEFLRTNAKLKQDIGDVKEFGRFVTGGVNLGSGGSGRATINLKVIGERKTVNASVDLVLVSGSSWRVSAAHYVNDSGQTIDLLDPYDSKLLIPLLIA
jgi:cytochrome oxidase complex assembly protein 1